MTAFRKWLRRRRHEQILRARQDGYGWAWSAWRLEGKPLDEIEALSDGFPGDDARGQAFDAGASLAVTDIRRLTGSQGKGVR